MAAVKELVRKVIAENNVMIFSKSWCPYCAKVKGLFNSIDVKYSVMDLDQRLDGAEIQAYLKEETGQSTVPNVFVNGQHAGGSDAIQKAKESGILFQMLESKNGKL